MARVKKNKLTEGLSGSFGSTMVFRTYKDKTIVSPKPGPRKKRKISPEEQKTQDRFREAGIYYNVAIKPFPQLYAEYLLISKCLNLKGARQAVITHRLSSPLLVSFKKRRTKGNKPKFNIILKDNYIAKEMLVSLTSPEGALLDQGAALFVFGDEAWQYNATATFTVTPGIKVTLQVTDRFGGKTVLESVMG